MTAGAHHAGGTGLPVLDSGATAGETDDTGGASHDGDAGGSASGTSLSGTLGTLGAVQPTVSSFVISNSGETLVYLSSAPIPCELLMMEGGRWHTHGGRTDRRRALPRGGQLRTGWQQY